LRETFAVQRSDHLLHLRQEKPILEYGTGAVSVGTNVYGKGIDEILERVAGRFGRSMAYVFPQQNHEGSVTLLIDPSGVVLERYRYDAFARQASTRPLGPRAQPQFTIIVSCSPGENTQPRTDPPTPPQPSISTSIEPELTARNWGGS